VSQGARLWRELNEECAIRGEECLLHHGHDIRLTETPARVFRTSRLQPGGLHSELLRRFYETIVSWVWVDKVSKKRKAKGPRASCRV